MIHLVIKLDLLSRLSKSIGDTGISDMNAECLIHERRWSILSALIDKGAKDLR